jgi:phytoene dehydrogenase-like protein
LAHPLDDGTAVLLWPDLLKTARQLGPDRDAYLRLMQPFVKDWQDLLRDVLGPLRPPRRPLLMGRFAALALQSAAGVANRFQEVRTRALLAGLGGHSIMPLEHAVTFAFALVEGALGHAVGWPLAAGGSQSIANSLASHLESLGGEIVTGTNIDSLDELPAARATLLDTAPRGLIQIAGDRLPPGYRKRLGRYRYGPGVFKVDWALDGPVPWQAETCRESATLHIGGTLEEISEAERKVWQGEHPERPFVIFAQQSLFDTSRAPEGKHTAWGYTHVPNGSSVDMTDRIEAQIDRFAPGFRDRILERHTRNAVEMESYNANYVGGDINAGVQDIRQIFTRPVARLSPYTTAVDGLYLCSSSTPPGGGVHGMCGYFAAQAALRRSFR